MRIISLVSKECLTEDVMCTLWSWCLHCSRTSAYRYVMRIFCFPQQGAAPSSQVRSGPTTAQWDSQGLGGHILDIIISAFHLFSPLPEYFFFNVLDNLNENLPEYRVKLIIMSTEFLQHIISRISIFSSSRDQRVMGGRGFSRRVGCQEPSHRQSHTQETIQTSYVISAALYLLQ